MKSNSNVLKVLKVVCTIIAIIGLLFIFSSEAASNEWFTYTMKGTIFFLFGMLTYFYLNDMKNINRKIINKLKEIKLSVKLIRKYHKSTKLSYFEICKHIFKELTK